MTEDLRKNTLLRPKVGGFKQNFQILVKIKNSEFLRWQLLII